MARYYDLDSLRVSDINVGTVMFPKMERCILLKDIESAPTADVVPKSEVDKMENAYYRATRKANKNAITAIQNAKQEVAREIFEEIESISSDFPIYGNVNTVILSERDLAFIKKKYTEG